VQVVKEIGGGIVRRVVLLDDAGDEVELVTRFLSPLSDSGYSPHTLCAYAYDLRYLVAFLGRHGLAWSEFRPSTALEFLAYLRRVPSRRPAQRLSLTVATGQGRLLSPATVARVLAATSSFFEWAIAAEEYTGANNPGSLPVRQYHRLCPLAGRPPAACSACRYQCGGLTPPTDRARRAGAAVSRVRRSSSGAPDALGADLVGIGRATTQRQAAQRAHPSHSPSRSNRAVAAASSRMITHEPATRGSSTMAPWRLLTIRFVNPIAPCCVQVTAMARELLPRAGTSC
jgi:hypothetical protein